ncbi:hypothetical protein EYF80_048811 [Liparis tanakae]|uniref:Uncharacterized protein n=1 Tax=Liparis tanakae TaxID=230148 RepID=A0A4Z2FII3_9TELE|nr:hypothetical protein EYF80_048811 [Liparis tanakae]
MRSCKCTAMFLQEPNKVGDVAARGPRSGTPSKEYCGRRPRIPALALLSKYEFERGDAEGSDEITRRCVFQRQNRESNPCRPSPIWRKREACGPEGRLFVEAIE